MTPELEMQWRPPVSFMILEIGHRQEPTRLPHGFVDRGAEITTIYGIGSLLRQGPQCIGEVSLHEPVTFPQRLAVAAEDALRIIAEFLERIATRFEQGDYQPHDCGFELDGRYLP